MSRRGWSDELWWMIRWLVDLWWVGWLSTRGWLNEILWRRGYSVFGTIVTRRQLIDVRVPLAGIKESVLEQALRAEATMEVIGDLPTGVMRVSTSHAALVFGMMKR